MSSFFYPKSSLIASISLGLTTEVTFTQNCDFTDGQVVSFRVSREYGTKELNNVQTRVISHTNNSITVNIESSNFTPFVYHDENEVVYPAVVVPAGSGRIPYSNPARVNLQDAFDNVPA